VGQFATIFLENVICVNYADDLLSLWEVKVAIFILFITAGSVFFTAFFKEFLAFTHRRAIGAWLAACGVFLHGSFCR
jgi:hypothetical protein